MNQLRRKLQVGSLYADKPQYFVDITPAVGTIAAAFLPNLLFVRIGDLKPQNIPGFRQCSFEPGKAMLRMAVLLSIMINSMVLILWVPGMKRGAGRSRVDKCQSQ